MKKYYKDLVEIPGVSSHEKYVRQYMRKHLEELSDEIIEDNLGSIFGGINLNSDGPTIMLAGHMDEIGAMVVGINNNGTIKMMAIGGISPQVVVSQHMNIVRNDGSFVPGVVGAKPPHLMKDKSDKQISSFDDLHLDIGADDDEHAKEIGVKIGQQIVFANDYKESIDGKKIFSKAWDNRFGSAMALDILESIDKAKLKSKLYAGASVQEEVGLRGAITSSYRVNPDLFIAVDCSPCSDTFEKTDVGGTLGDGFLLRFYDPRTLMHQGLKKFIEDLANKHNIKYQYYSSKGGTDAAAAQLSRGGTLACTIGMPARYIHSTTSIIHKEDYQAVRAIILAMLETIDNDAIKEIKANV
ncbi:MAG: M42 family metallopeptidase [Bacillota bacterium]